ncbi:TPA: tRNA (N6-threonylcarbamoyladenosine(37)-N6)-methyltransferase TrmO [Clostridioides difficile]|mgnify:FL=1|uniref:tRNA (N6-threonylcarbamoyladenosine(37)-N6)-methyltransferase TrmO n=1 Tax=Bacillota TaxID=1239 RepID=UPI00038CDEF7|nr:MULTISPECIES: tRNA (N6-threonylcarbamoyladenosine(37)-N6)-methyltransferase TrmO [Bacillota]MCR0251310.1 tRNA (N6-threonylcarbamoyladenosine(37)-N6)-methyltransferase TrmO [[Clostridium] innocuum]EGT3748338.1 tRNA (N6-threonylcarbamoyladenosine(37)-N6)-methyltransferase TrmO [Clostridioides difficile]EGT3754570.1 tRNA (N6-threonylcarbamoyladenosine(37)-N6)-methyltransferase TrmO [Clostridioides difficile]EGT3781381.1 tRNA (N6-threonylcarbamoyladenosine(37)-N6)-methyltransferase TrmO [Clostri
MTTYKVNSIGTIYNNEKGAFIQLEAPYILALRALDGFSHINVLWWFSDFDNTDFRSVLETEQPYKNAPEKMGIFATRSPVRPNPIALSVVEIINIDYMNGMIQIAYIDANDKTPILDIKPYTPSLDRVENPNVPDWCSHWPHSLEESASFAWENEFNF